MNLTETTQRQEEEFEVGCNSNDELEDQYNQHVKPKRKGKQPKFTEDYVNDLKCYSKSGRKYILLDFEMILLYILISYLLYFPFGCYLFSLTDYLCLNFFLLRKEMKIIPSSFLCFVFVSSVLTFIERMTGSSSANDVTTMKDLICAIKALLTKLHTLESKVVEPKLQIDNPLPPLN